MKEKSRVSHALHGLMELVIATQPGLSIPPQDQLAKQLGVSRAVIREAISKLEYLDVVAVRPKTGTIVNASSAWRVTNTDVIEWRVRAEERREQVLAELSRVAA